MTYRRNNNLCLRYGKPGHRVKECKYLAPLRPALSNRAVAAVDVDLKEAEAEGSESEAEKE